MIHDASLSERQQQPTDFVLQVRFHGNCSFECAACYGRISGEENVLQLAEHHFEIVGKHGFHVCIAFFDSILCFVFAKNSVEQRGAGLNAWHVPTELRIQFHSFSKTWGICLLFRSPFRANSDEDSLDGLHSAHGLLAPLFNFPQQLAGAARPLHRQNVLPVDESLLASNVGVSDPRFPDGTMLGYMFLPEASPALHGVIPSIALQLRWEDVAIPPWSTTVLCSDEQFHEPFIARMRHFLESATAWILDYFEDLLIGSLLAMQEHTTAFFRTFLMLLLFNLFHLCAYALPKKGGAVNCDNIIWMKRISTSWTPWTMCGIASKFSPAHHSFDREGTPKKRSKRSCKCSRYSTDFILLLLLLALCIPTCNAAAGRSDGLDPRGFRAERRSRKLHQAVYNRRTAARDLFSSSSEEDDFWDDLPNTTREFHLFGTGCWREVIIASLILL